MALHTPKHMLEKRIEAVIAGRQRSAFLSLATLLHGASLLYGTGIRIRQLLYDHGVLPAGRVNRPVISIGNLTAGGTGKTPMTLHLATLLSSLGLKATIVSRGYRSLSEKTGAVVSDGRSVLCDARTAGDEPYLMARLLSNVPVVVGKDRFKTASAALRRFKSDVILLDDAYQHQRLSRDVNLLLLDADAPFGNGYLLPRGSLREPLSALQRADAVILTRCTKPSDGHQRKLERMVHPRPVFHSRHVAVVRWFVPAHHLLDGTDPARLADGVANPLQDRPVFAFAALARNETFWSTVTGMGAHICGRMGFSDHHFYSRNDINTLIDAAHRSGCPTLVTTDKDFVRLPKMSLPLDLIVLGVDIDFGVDNDRFRLFISERVRRVRKS